MYRVFQIAKQYTEPRGCAFCRPEVGTPRPGGRTGSYIVGAPRTLRPGLPYAVSVNILEEGLARIGADATENLVVLEIQDRHGGQPKAFEWVRNVKPGRHFALMVTLCDFGALARLQELRRRFPFLRKSRRNSEVAATICC